MIQYSELAYTLCSTDSDPTLQEPEHRSLVSLHCFAFERVCMVCVCVCACVRKKKKARPKEKQGWPKKDYLHHYKSVLSCCLIHLKYNVNIPILFSLSVLPCCSRSPNIPLLTLRKHFKSSMIGDGVSKAFRDYFPNLFCTYSNILKCFSVHLARNINSVYLSIPPSPPSLSPSLSPLSPPLSLPPLVLALSTLSLPPFSLSPSSLSLTCFSLFISIYLSIYIYAYFIDTYKYVQYMYTVCIFVFIERDRQLVWNGKLKRDRNHI